MSRCAAKARSRTRSINPRRVSTRSASGISPSPQTFSRGNDCLSKAMTRTPCRARHSAAVAPAGPHPTTATSQSGSTLRPRLLDRRHQIEELLRRHGRLDEIALHLVAVVAAQEVRLFAELHAL